MKILKTYEKFINKEKLEDIYDKYYSDISMDIFKKIVKADPTSLIDGILYVGKYSKWLLKLFKEDKLKLEDLYKATEYLELFDKQSVRNKLDIKYRNINNFKSLGELAEVISDFKNSDEIKSKSEIKEDNLVKEFDNYKLYIPKNFKDSCVLGKGTEWCTATEKTDKWFKKYHRSGRELLIFISKDDPKEKYQFHFRTRQFMDIFDNGINIKEFLNENPDIDSWLKENVKDYKRINSDGDVRWYKSNFDGCPEIIEGNFNCYNNNLTSLEGCPQKVEGDFNCSYNNLTSLEGCPKKVEGNFYCDDNQLTSLVGGPKIVEGNFDCSRNKLTSLLGCPEIIEGFFDCSSNKLITLVGAPEIVEGDFNCNNNQLTSLKGGPKIIEGNFYCSHNQLTSLLGGPEIVEGNFNCRFNKLTNLEGCPKIVDGDFSCSNNQFLISLEGCAEIIEGNFDCRNNPHLTEKDFEWLKENCDIKGLINNN